MSKFRYSLPILIIFTVLLGALASPVAAATPPAKLPSRIALISQGQGVHSTLPALSNALSLHELNTPRTVTLASMSFVIPPIDFNQPLPTPSITHSQLAELDFGEYLLPVYCGCGGCSPMQSFF